MQPNKEEYIIHSALSQVDTPDYDMEDAIRQAMVAKAPVRRHPHPRAGLLAAALVAVLAVGAAAAGVSGLWGTFFHTPIPQSAVTTVGVSQTAGDYTLTVEDAMADDNGIILLLALTRADGEQVDPSAALQSNSMNVKLLADGTEFWSRGNFEDRFLSEDGKTLYLSYEARDNRPNAEELTGKELTFTADGVAVTLYSPGSFGYRPEETADLSLLVESTIADFSDWGNSWKHGKSDDAITSAIEDADLSLPLPLNEEFPQFTLRGAVTTPVGLGIALSQGRGENGDRVCTGVAPEALIDTRDSARYEMNEGNGVTLSDGTNAMLYTFRDCPLTAEDLPYLELEVYYDIDRILSTKPFSLAFNADSTALILPLDQAITVADAPLHPTELRLSALGVSLRFADNMDTVHVIYATKTAPVVTQKDGTVIPTRWQGGYGGADDTCSVSFWPETEDDQRIFLDTAQIQSVTFGGTTLWTAP